ncbi:hypothetical protein [Colwellia sp. UCD-KL20]|uniref:hypothetical protein n=1 Tax=Colwellia sp. UCD-KL20 TaxID=1917165 RepID=UPI00097073A9|nr:hypothetical protein [Colwellia sp. UCD-KL20]
MLVVDELAKQAIKLLQIYIEHLGFKPLIHFELEGCFQSSNKHSQPLDYATLNKQLAALNIDGQLIPEYWSNQWEYISLFNGQSPLKEADNLSCAIKKIPVLFALQGIKHTLIKPVVWSGDSGKLALGSKDIFTNEQRAVHIPNAIQMNISALDDRGKNIIPYHGFGEYLQQCFLHSSLSCCLLYMPEEEAFERLKLKDKYGLAQELCSPIDLSGGHQGSIALYKKVGKHNQPMGEEPLLYDHNNKVMVSTLDWEKTARIEHRLGASSVYYNAYTNVVFGLLNLIEALEKYTHNACAKEQSNSTQGQLPESLYDKGNKQGAISLFMESSWFNTSLNKIELKVNQIFPDTYKVTEALGDKLKLAIVQSYQQAIILEK